MDQSTIPEESASRYPLTSRQKDPNHTERSSKHVIALALRIREELRVDAIMGALADVVERHESLRTRVHYDEADGNIGFQEILPPMPVPFTVHDIPLVPGRSRDDIAVDLLVTLNDELLPYTATPSVSAALHRFDDRDAVLTLLSHHLYSDGWSVEILRREFVACYRARVSGTPHELPAPGQYREYAVWEEEFMQSGKAATARRFWADKLAGAELCTLPADRTHGPDTLTARSAVGNFSIDPDDFAKVVASATQNRCTVWNLLLAAWAVLAENIHGRSDITMLTVGSGRPDKNFHNTIGFFANLVPLRLEFGECTSFRDLMLLVRKANADAHQHQIPFGTIMELQPGLMNSFGDSQAVPPAFIYISSPVASADLEVAGGIEPVVLPEEVPSMFHRGACVWSFTVLPTGAFRCVVEYEPDAVDASTVDRWGSDFVGLVRAIAAEPDRAWKIP